MTDLDALLPALRGAPAWMLAGSAALLLLALGMLIFQGRRGR